MFHVDQMKVEIRRLGVLISQRCRRVGDLVEAEIKYDKDLRRG